MNAADRLLTESRQEEYRTRRLLRRVSRDELVHPGPPVRVKDVALLAGISKQKVFADADRGEVIIKPLPCGQKWMGVIERADALRYLDKISTCNTA